MTTLTIWLRIFATNTLMLETQAQAHLSRALLILVS